MSKKLAIKGHATRGKEVIELLEMMGGTNPFTINDGVVIGNKETSCYHIAEDSATKYISWDYLGSEDIDKYKIFSLEEFLEKYPFKVGDKVVYTKFGYNYDDCPVTIESMKWTGTTIEYTFDGCVTCLAKDLKMWNGEPDEVISGIYLNSCDYADEVELNLGDYEIEVRDGRTFAVLKKPKYPKTYKECCDVLLIPPYYNLRYHTYEPNYDEYATSNTLLSLENKLNTLGKLLICRDAYWKIASEEMGLGRSWDQCDTKDKYIIRRAKEEILKGYNISSVLEFPTPEMRDTFYENFKELINSCKELL